ncbi:MAG: CatA-like O-acetyltransferase [bacterium]
MINKLKGSFLDLQRWKRKDHFDLYKTYEQPHFNICADVDVANTVEWTRKHQKSFFSSCLYICTKAANDLEPFRYRLRDDGVYLYEQIDAGSTVLNTDDTFSFCYFDYDADFSRFHNEMQETLQPYKEGRQSLVANRGDDAIMYFTVMPWIHFKSMSHASHKAQTQSIPLIAIGKYEEKNNQLAMPVSVQVHHALMDGIDVGRYFELITEYFKTPENVLE